MNLTFPKIGSAVAATVAVSTGMLAISCPADAFMITRTPGLQPGINAPLAPPTVIDFNTGPNTPTTLTTFAQSIGPGGPNGGATIKKTGTGTGPTLSGSNLTMGNGNGGANSPGNGSVEFSFNDLRGMGYLGFNWANLPQSNESIQFFFGDTLRGALTGTQVLANIVGLNNNSDNYFNFFVTNNNEIFNRVVFTRTASNNPQFTIDNLAYQAIPTPALLPGLLAMGVGVWRKRRATADAGAEA